MRLVYHRPGQNAWELVADATIETPTDAIVRITSSTICGTDLHILKATSVADRWARSAEGGNCYGPGVTSDPTWSRHRFDDSSGARDRWLGSPRGAATPGSRHFYVSRRSLPSGSG
jgi:hypothetical protein